MGQYEAAPTSWEDWRKGSVLTWPRKLEGKAGPRL